MSQAILSFLEGWWARWFHRAGGVRTEFSTFTPAPAAEVPEPEVAEAVAAFDLKEAEQSFLETVRIDPAKAAAKVPFVAAPQVRASTLAALEHLKQIPALQSLVQGVTQIMGRDGVTVDEVVGALEKDSALCVRILTMANSVSVASEQRIVDLQTAVQMLGIARVRRLAQAVFTLRGAQQMAEGLDWRHLWIHALATAAVAEELDRRTSSETSPQIYMAGLLHDVGKIVLSTVDPDAYRDIVVASWNMEGRLEDLEVARMGVGHREAGVIFARANHLSEVVVEVIAHHDNPGASETHRYEVALVAIANFMCKARGLGFSGARLDAADGEIEDLPGWKILTEKSGWTPNAALMQKDMAAFFATLREDLRGIGSGA
jgi:putative nucleotidyltransferase with HDIG domain